MRFTHTEADEVLEFDSPDRCRALTAKSDEQLSIEWGKPLKFVQLYREIFHKKALRLCRTAPSKSLSDPDFIRALGSAPDSVIAKQFGLLVRQVRKARESEKIQPYKPEYNPITPTWSQAEIALIGTAPDPEVAEKLGNINPKLVTQKRKELGIPSFADFLHEQRYQKTVWTDEMIKRLGTRTDEYIAKQLKIDEWIVTRKRMELQISYAPSYLLSHLDNSD